MTFWVLAFLVTTIALGAVWLPLRGKNKRLAATVASVLIVAVATGMYFQLGHWQTDEAAELQAGFSPEAMVESLAARLKNKTGTLDEYMMLGRSYMQLKRYPDAAKAYAKAMELSGGNNADVISIYAESLAMTQGLEGDAVALTEKALSLDPNNARALLYGGLIAREKGDYAQALERWQRLSDQSSEKFKQDLAPQLAELNRLAGLEASAPVNSEQPTDASNALATETVHVTVTAPQALTDALNPNTLLFVVARATSGGPPLAVVRKTLNDLPLSVDLSDADAMMEGNTLSRHTEVNVSARLALRGTAIRQSGDLMAETLTKVGSEVELVISQVVP